MRSEGLLGVSDGVLSRSRKLGLSRKKYDGTKNRVLSTCHQDGPIVIEARQIEERH